MSRRVNHKTLVCSYLQTVQYLSNLDPANARLEETMTPQEEHPGPKNRPLLYCLGGILLVLGAALAGAFIARQIRESETGHTYYEFICGGAHNHRSRNHCEPSPQEPGNQIAALSQIG